MHGDTSLTGFVGDHHLMQYAHLLQQLRNPDGAQYLAAR